MQRSNYTKWHLLRFKPSQCCWGKKRNPVNVVKKNFCFYRLSLLVVIQRTLTNTPITTWIIRKCVNIFLFFRRHHLGKALQQNITCPQMPFVYSLSELWWSLFCLSVFLELQQPGADLLQEMRYDPILHQEFERLWYFNTCSFISVSLLHQDT